MKQRNVINLVIKFNSNCVYDEAAFIMLAKLFRIKMIITVLNSTP